MTRLAAVHLWPVVPNPPQIAPSTAKSILASSITMMAFLPPISRLQCLKLGAQVSETVFPTAVEPVKETNFTSGCFIRGIPTPAPEPKMMLTTPLGMPASSQALIKFKAERGVSVAGLNTTVLPQIKAGISFHDGMAMGKFHGVIKAQTPMGWRTDMANLLGSSAGVVWPNCLRPSPAM